jgi:hypothetical protein
MQYNSTKPPWVRLFRLSQSRRTSRSSSSSDGTWLMRCIVCCAATPTHTSCRCLCVPQPEGPQAVVSASPASSSCCWTRLLLQQGCYSCAICACGCTVATTACCVMLPCCYCHNHSNAQYVTEAARLRVLHKWINSNTAELFDNCLLTPGTGGRLVRVVSA